MHSVDSSINSCSCLICEICGEESEVMGVESVFELLVWIHGVVEWLMLGGWVIVKSCCWIFKAYVGFV
jgi:hypothetical protein